ncbi:glucosidase family protein [Shewanella sedimentimangrovi]|uniref:Alpha-L-rhamnosidase six-hairpin glycosidase domain-containing protein n=1 Tax=Shewanella sedimentimangrovi TaxID=2814293 RepID=A0ABX7QZ99_9GAMM|nr:hypothetical protein [Shewanella sedimentimangrovi]QSX36574.1 hypothetical protein JYB85_14985 [Shewanella sedimentimangrovi]
MTIGRRQFLTGTLTLAGATALGGSLLGCRDSGGNTSAPTTSPMATNPEVTPKGEPTGLRARAAAPARFRSSDTHLEAGYLWASAQALSLVRRGDAVGDWYEAALPNREAFCMRDTAHQTSGAAVLGLADVSKNMLTKFVQGISAERDWCSYWEIDRHDRPAPVDYTSDQDFWYNLPANFDLIDCCWRQYLWTGDKDYLEHPDFVEFYERTVSDYVRRWDRTGNGIMDSTADLSRRGIASYDEALSNLQTASDQIVIQASGYRAYGAMLALRGEHDRADMMQQEASRLLNLYNQEWWNDAGNHSYGALLRDGSKTDIEYYYGLYFGAYNNSDHRQKAMATLLAHPAPSVEYLSHFPDICYRYGLAEQGHQQLLRLTAPELPRRDYPEASFCAVGAYVAGLMGISADARSNSVSTRPQLSQATEWAEIDELSLLGRRIKVSHRGNGDTELTLIAGEPLQWRAMFAAEAPVLKLNGQAMTTKQCFAEGEIKLSYLDVPLTPGQSARVQLG